MSFTERSSGFHVHQTDALVVAVPAALVSQKLHSPPVTKKSNMISHMQFSTGVHYGKQ